MNLLPGRNERDAFDEALSEISTDRIEQEPGELSLSGRYAGRHSQAGGWPHAQAARRHV